MNIRLLAPIYFSLIYAIHFAGLSMLTLNEYNSPTINNNEIFWFTSAGVTVKAIIDVTLTTILLMIVFSSIKSKQSLIKIISLALISHSSFTLKLLLESIQISLYSLSHKPISETSLDLGSISYFLSKTKTSSDFQNTYILNNFGFFELLAFTILIFYLHYKYGFKILESIKISVLAYLLPLITWLLFVTIIIYILI